MGIFGCGIGLGYMPLVTISWKYFPEHKGLLSGIILACFGSGTFMWSAIADKIINPENKQTVDGYYPPESPESSNINKFWLFMIFTVIGCLIIVFLLGFDYEEDNNNGNENKLIEENKEKENKDNKVNTKLLLKIFFSWEYSRIVIMSVCCTIFIYLLSITMKSFGVSVNDLSLENINILSYVTAIENGICRVIWGQVIDCIGIKLALFIDISIFIGASGFYYFCGSNIVLYYIINIIAQIGTSGNSVLMPMINRQKSGEYFLILMGYAGLYYGLSSWIGPFFVKVLDIQKRGGIVYMITYLICCGCSILSLILACSMGDEPIDYNKYKSPDELNLSEIKTESLEMKEEN
jgi:OFA family oxalate/formate antiporter-like MFS transporter